MEKLKYLLDTNVISEPLYENPNLQVMYKYQGKKCVVIIVARSIQAYSIKLSH